MGVSWESLGLLEALLGSFKSEKMLTVPRENHLFVNAVFWLFAALMALLGSSLSVLGGFGSRMGFPKFSKRLSKVCQKMIKKSKKMGAKMGFKSYLNRDRRLKAFSSKASVLSFILGFNFFCTCL